MYCVPNSINSQTNRYIYHLVSLLCDPGLHGGQRVQDFPRGPADLCRTGDSCHDASDENLMPMPSAANWVWHLWQPFLKVSLRRSTTQAFWRFARWMSSTGIIDAHCSASTDTIALSPSQNISIQQNCQMLKGKGRKQANWNNTSAQPIAHTSIWFSNLGAYIRIYL